jgi:diguanylate cyclase (GGDEF)-like protein
MDNMVDRFKRRWRSFLTGGHRVKYQGFEQYNTLTKLKFLNFALLLGTIFSTATLVIQLVSGWHFALPLYIVLPGFFPLLILLLRKRNCIGLVSHSLIALYLCFTFFSALRGGVYAYVNLFFLISFPVGAYYLLGRRDGTLWVGAYMAVYLSLMALKRTGVLETTYPPTYVMLGFVNLAVVSFFVYLTADRHHRIVRFMEKQIYLDPLTNLQNRNKLLIDIANTQSPTLFIINVDDFKEINAIFGYRIGDSVLIFLGRIISHILPDYVEGLYKLAGDEYAVLIDMEKRQVTQEMLVETAQSIARYVQQERYGYAKYEVMLRVSMGIAQFENIGSRNLFTCADIALKTAKQYRKSYMFYEDARETRSKFEENLKWIKILADAIESDRIFPYYQPIIINETGEIDKYECLARIADRGGKIYTPEFFMNIAKKSRLYEKITRAIVRKTFEAFKDSDTEFSINMSVEDFLDPYTLQYIKFALSEYPTVRNRVSFEILETESVTDFEKFATYIDDMKNVGCKIAIDDFGAGYSNFDFLLKLQLDYLKIDGTLIEKMDTDVNSRIIVENIVNFSRKMGIKTIAEYVHSQQIFDIVKSLGIDYSQGFFLGEPKPAVQDATRAAQYT